MVGKTYEGITVLKCLCKVKWDADPKTLTTNRVIVLLQIVFGRMIIKPTN